MFDVTAAFALLRKKHSFGDKCVPKREFGNEKRGCSLGTRMRN